MINYVRTIRHKEIEFRIFTSDQKPYLRNSQFIYVYGLFSRGTYYKRFTVTDEFIKNIRGWEYHLCDSLIEIYEKAKSNGSSGISKSLSSE